MSVKEEGFMENKFTYILINGADLTGKTVLSNNFAQDFGFLIQNSYFTKNHPLNKLATRLRREKIAGQFSEESIKALYSYAKDGDPVLKKLIEDLFPIISDEIIGHLYANAAAEEIAAFNPQENIVQDSSGILKSYVIHKSLGSDRKLVDKLEKLLIRHPKPSKPNYSILLEADLDAKRARLEKRYKNGEFYMADTDEIIFRNPDLAIEQAKIMKEAVKHAFPNTTIIDTTKLTEKQVYDEVRNHFELEK